MLSILQATQIANDEVRLDLIGIIEDVARYENDQASVKRMIDVLCYLRTFLSVSHILLISCMHLIELSRATRQIK